jgi:hypothetical protein
MLGRWRHVALPTMQSALAAGLSCLIAVHGVYHLLILAPRSLLLPQPITYSFPLTATQ